MEKINPKNIEYRTRNVEYRNLLNIEYRTRNVEYRNTILLRIGIISRFKSLITSTFNIPCSVFDIQKKHSPFLSKIGVLFFLMTFLAYSASAQLSNGSFELWSNEPIPKAWAVNGHPWTLPPWDPYVVRKDSMVKHSGMYSAQLFYNNFFAAKATSETKLLPNKMPSAVTAWVKTSLAQGKKDTVTIRLSFFCNDTALLNEVRWQGIETTDWTQIAIKTPIFSGSCPPNKLKIELIGGNKVTNNEPTLFWIDDVALVYPQPNPIKYLNATSQWKEHEFGVFGIPSLHYRLYMKEDTVWNGKTYHKIWEEGINELPPQLGGNEILDRLHCLLREENAKFYTIFGNQTQEQLLYDFDLNVGDIVYFNSPYQVVDSITTFKFGNETRKKFHLSGQKYMARYSYLLEGIGSQVGISPDYNLFEGGKSLLCYRQNNKLYETWDNSCDLLSDKMPSAETHFKCYPNPANDVIYIDFDTNTNSAFVVQLYNSLGQLVLSKSSDSAENRLDISTLPQGIYVVKVLGKEGRKVFQKM
jgi:Secretion system C-terminal sorting domain